MAEHRNTPKEAPEGKTVREVELVKVVVSRDGQRVSAQWAIHPQMKLDLQPEQWHEISDLMSKITSLVGSRFAQILTHAEPPDRRKGSGCHAGRGVGPPDGARSHMV